MPFIFRIVVWLILGVGTAAAEPLHSGSTGEDFMAASDAERTDLLVRIAPAIPGSQSLLVKAIALQSCLVQMLTPRKRGEAEGVTVLRRNKLSELAAACALILETRVKRR
jgi:hypothetical protein